MSKKILITGASSKTGEALYDIITKETDYKVFLVSSQAEILKLEPNAVAFECSAIDHQKLRGICIEVEPDYIVNCAALTDVDYCEENKKLAQELNVKAVENLTSVAKILNSGLIQISTDYIFDGLKGPYLEDAKPNPINYYGKTKLAAENIVLQSQLNFAILRTSVLYGKSNYDKINFVDKVIDNAERELPLNAIDSLYGNPTLTIDLALTILKIIEKNKSGIYNAAGSDYLNRFEFAESIFDIFKLDKSFLKKIKASELKLKAKRPAKAGLINLKASTDLGVKFVGVESGLTTYKFLLNSGIFFDQEESI